MFSNILYIKQHVLNIGTGWLGLKSDLLSLFDPMDLKVWLTWKCIGLESMMDLKVRLTWNCIGLESMKDLKVWLYWSMMVLKVWLYWGTIDFESTIDFK